MGRHTTEDAKQVANIDKRRLTALDKFFGLTEKVLKHIEWSIEATKPCTACVFIEGQGFKAGKAKRLDGKCAMCGNTGLAPDINQRNWATGEIADRVAPKPKSVEMTVDNATERKELEKEISQLEEADLDKQLEALGVHVKNN